MKNLNSKMRVCVICVLTTFALVCVVPAALAAETKSAAPAKASATLANLMKSFNGESNAHARYLAFAKKADEEGYKQVATLFRATAAAEEVHFKAQAEVIKKLGGTPKADIAAPEVKSTKENLAEAIKGESYERDTMYPEFIKVAEKEEAQAALMLFKEAQAVESGHAKLYQEAAGNLENWKTGGKDFFVCPECGNTVMALSFEKCPVCSTSKGKFIKVS